MSTAYCYYTNGRGTNDLRRMSVASLKRFVGDVPVFTVFAGEKYENPLPGETVIDLCSVCKRWFGADGKELAEGCPGNRSLPLGIFSKYLIPVSREFVDFDQVVVIDDDIEIISPKFAEIGDWKLRPDADVGMILDSVTPEHHDEVLGKRRSRTWWFPGSHYHCGGLLVFRAVDERKTYTDRVATMFSVNAREKYFLNEETAANQFLSVQTLDPVFCMIPKVSSAHRDGVTGERLKRAYSLHYAGRRKTGVVDDWRRRFEEGRDVDLDFFK